MNEKPSYLGLLNAVALGEKRAGEYLNCWASVTTNPDVCKVIHTVALREAEHGLAFEKRVDELGFALVDRPDPEQESKMAIASSTTLTDREKFEKLGLGRRQVEGKADIFDRFFENKDLDPTTGGLLGRYIAEERDTGRKFAACYEALCAAESCEPQAMAGSTRSGDSLAGLADQVATAGRQLADLVRDIAGALAEKR